MGKEEGEAAGHHCNILSFFLNSFSLCLLVFFFFSFEGSNLNVDGNWDIVQNITLLVCSCWHLFNMDLLRDHYCAGRETF